MRFGDEFVFMKSILEGLGKFEFLEKLVTFLDYVFFEVRLLRGFYEV